MKKLLALVLAGAMALSMVACSSEETTSDGDDESKLKVRLVVANLGDKSFNDSANAGLQRCADDYGIDYKVIEYTNDPTKVRPTLQEAAEDYDVVVCNNLNYGVGCEWIQANAANYPDTTFIVYDEPNIENSLENVQHLCYKANESDFIAGALAAKLSESGIIGFVGGQETPVIHDFLVGYIQGAQYVNPDIKVTVSYVGTYDDVTKGKELGNTAINDARADVIHAVAGAAGNGALEAARIAGKYSIGVDSDQYELLKDPKEGKPEIAASIVTSSLKNVGESLYLLMGTMLDGTYTWQPQLWYGMAENCAGIAENENYEALVSEEIRAEIDQIKADLAEGKIEVKSAYGMTSDEINDMVNAVKK